MSPSSWEVTPSDRYIIDIGEIEFPILPGYFHKKGKMEESIQLETLSVKKAEVEVDIFFFSVDQERWSIKLQGVVRFFFFTFVTLIYD